jgi:hypothetical protein
MIFYVYYNIFCNYLPIKMNFYNAFGFVILLTFIDPIRVLDRLIVVVSLCIYGKLEDPDYLKMDF